MVSPIEEVLFCLSRWVLRRGGPSLEQRKQWSASNEAYAQWRRQNLAWALEHYFPRSLVRGKDVLDFGSGRGALTRRLAEEGARSVLGIELNEEHVRNCQEEADRDGLRNVRFRVGHLRGIDCPDESVDLITCFSVLEHVMCPEEIVREWHRVLRPGGQVWVDWRSWRYYAASHVYDFVRIPWVHLFVSERVLLAASARIYDDPCYEPRFGETDPQTTEKLPNPFKAGRDIYSWVNQLTLPQFRSMGGSAGFRVRSRIYGLGQQTRKARPIGMLALLPMIGEYFASGCAVILTKRRAALGRPTA